MSLNRRSRAASLGAALCIHVASASLLAITPACSMFVTTNTNVADGKLYEPGEADYDAFFKELYDAQLLMGTAPERESGARARVAKALDLPEDSKTDAIGDALYERAAILAKAGVMLKLSLADVDAGASPTATVVVIGEVKDEKDKKLVEALEVAVKADAELLTELRKAKKPLDKMRGTAASLEPRIDTAFASSSKAKKDEVRRNFDDARQLVPLMTSRGDDVHRQTVQFLTALQKVLGAPTSAGGPSEPEEPSKKGKAAKPKAPPAAKPVSKPVPAPRAVPKAEPKSEPKEPAPPAAKKAPVEPKKPKAPAEDFEP
jgi:hypothetical protein